MGFWIFMLTMELLIPVTMIGYGKIFLKKVPKEINGMVGYRTSMSMKNKETWEFAHLYCGKLWYRLGWVSLFPSVIAMLFVIGKDNDTVGYRGLIITIIQCVLLIGPIFPTERALRRNFDRDGRRLQNKEGNKKNGSQR